MVLDHRLQILLDADRHARLVERLDEFEFERLPVSDVHAWAVRALPPVNNDPFDRLLAAQAICEGATIVSADAVFDAYAVTRIW
jgi:PIN domain nuclease of toxin-antitoxin system